ncbi:hypothetical protein [Altererythrobacter lutimaris]|uniref:hypothetical protein n=1 Tax=Altererythrobacter lutimaris TaxID=2743979 RepID=UPI001E2AD2F9|nr:hypothetical protein [Altererythrobacter lutimaris]
MKRSIAATLLASPALLLAAPAAAQDEAGDKVNMVIAYDESECPESAAENEIVVCEILVEAERYRVPAALRTSDSPENRSWSQRVESIRYIGEFGTMSCSPAGAGGFLGCTQQMIDAAYKDRSEASNVRFAQLIEQARAQRLSTIDEDAAAEQERVEQIEREYLERLERERDAPLPGEATETALPPLVGPEAPADVEDADEDSEAAPE